MAPQKPIEVEKPIDVAKSAPDKDLEVKAVATSLQSLHKLETQVTIDVHKKDIDKLGTDLQTECSTKALQTIDLLSSGTAIEKIPADSVEWLDTFIGWNLVGTIHGKLLRDAKNTGGTVDKNKYLAARKLLQL
jgi:hypothetical protein